MVKEQIVKAKVVKEKVVKVVKVKKIRTDEQIATDKERMKLVREKKVVKEK